MILELIIGGAIYGFANYRGRQAAKRNRLGSGL
jgi:hypothetical protein